MRELFPGDVIQIKPEENMLQTNIDMVPAAPCFQGCLAIVNEVHDWGILVNIVAPLAGQDKGVHPGLFTIPLRNGSFVYVGVSAYHMGTRDDV